ncbi:hypothetical protein [Maridesulfovibrio sp.]|uniref:hypothetical protein n=1 Tax=Maridesulfovibrio sp. TaxID=2795000 RepID=UPI002A18AD54|nr:hypothetical protein [Maridesulfovibrio sp.]
MFNRRKIEQLKTALTTFGLLLTILICTSASAYATYTGLIDSVSPFIASTVALASFFLMLYFSNIIAKFLSSTHSFISRILLIITAAILIFSSSTMWSIVGLSKNEIYRLSNYDQYKTFSNNFTESDLIPKYITAQQSINIAQKDTERILKNSSQGLYTGNQKKGTIWKSATIVDKKISDIQNKVDSNIEKINASQKIITSELSIMESDPESFTKRNYSNHVRTINLELQKILSPGIGIGQISLENSIKNLEQTLREYSQQKQTSTQKALTTEANTLQGDLEQIQKAFKALDITIAPLKDLASSEPTIKLCYNNILNMLHWWALCLTLDFVPFLFMIILVQKTITNPGKRSLNFTNREQ